MIIIRLENEFGKQLSEIIDRNDDIPRILKSVDLKATCCWKFIDNYGNTIFNRLQAEKFIVETEALMSAEVAKESKDFLRQLLSMAKDCVAHVHQYLRFIGE